MKKILITGGAGFIGYHLAVHLIETYPDACELVLVDNFFRGKMDSDFTELLQEKGVRFIDADLTDLASYKKLGGGYDYVYHLAAVNGTKSFYEMPHEVLRINTLALIYMLDWFRTENGEGKLCFTSSNEAYAGALSAFASLPLPTPENVPLVIEDPYNPRWSYAATKLIGELFVIQYAEKYDFSALIVRPHNFYGPRAGFGGHVIPDFSENIANRIDPFPIHGAEDTRTFCYITDAVRAMDMLMKSPGTDTHPPETVHIGSVDEVSIKELADRMFDITGWRPQKVVVTKSPPGSVKRRCADITKLQRLTGWKPEVPLNEGLRMTHEWYVTHNKIYNN